MKWGDAEATSVLARIDGGASIKALAAEINRSEGSIQQLLRRRYRMKIGANNVRLMDIVRPHVEQNRFAREVSRELSGYTYNAVSQAMTMVRKEMGLPNAKCRSGHALKPSLIAHARYNEEAKKRGYPSATALIDEILEIIISDNMIDAILDDQDQARAA